ncbi:hypothetical protein KR059_006845 [Drosophila kikkawai]|nr:hypothetical protein KR059_006845 [Drosophila kikkawai]
MTAETLKPFITPTSAGDGFPAMSTSAATAQRRTRQLVPIFLGVIGLVLVTGILGLTIWQTTRVTHLSKELRSLKRVVDNLQQRLGIDFLEEFDEFQKEYENALIDYPKKQEDFTDDDDMTDDMTEDEDEDAMNPLDDEDDMEDGNVDGTDEDENYTDEDGTDYEDYNEMITKLNSKLTTEEAAATTPTSDPTEGGDSSSASNDDNVFDDFTSYNDRKKKQERKSRSIADVRNEQQIVQGNHTTHTGEKTSDEPVAKESSPLHHRRKTLTRMGRHRILPRKGESLISARSGDLFAASSSSKPAAHFHLSSRKPHNWPPSYNGDMYIGNAPEESKRSWQGHFRVEDGVLQVLEPGLYYVYAQICYHNSHDQNGFIVFQGHKAFLQCLNTVPTNMSQKVHTCHTSGLINLDKDETIHLKDIHTDRNAILRESNNRSYFGIFKV